MIKFRHPENKRIDIDYVGDVVLSDKSIAKIVSTGYDFSDWKDCFFILCEKGKDIIIRGKFNFSASELLCKFIK